MDFLQSYNSITVQFRYYDINQSLVYFKPTIQFTLCLIGDSMLRHGVIVHLWLQRRITRRILWGNERIRLNDTKQQQHLYSKIFPNIQMFARSYEFEI